ncbi:MAG: hypothetical protein ACJASR_002536, partial [Psychroserpens sp.]
VFTGISIVKYYLFFLIKKEIDFLGDSRTPKNSNA